MYQSLQLPYTSPFVGMFIFAPCYLKLIQNLEFYLQSELTFIERSKYDAANAEMDEKGKYLIGQLDNDIELHLVHYDDKHDALAKWNKRVKRVNLKKLFFTFTDRDDCELSHIKQFDNLPFEHKVCFTAKEYPSLKSCINIPEYSAQPYVGNLYADFNIVKRHFDYIDWLNGGTGRV